MDATRTQSHSSRRLTRVAIVALAFALALMALPGVASADAHSRIKRPHQRKAHASQKKRKVVVTGKHGHSTGVTTTYGSPAAPPTIGENQEIVGIAPSSPSPGSTGSSKSAAPATIGTPSVTTETTPAAPVSVPPVAPEPPAQTLPTPELPASSGLLFDGTKSSQYSIEAAPHAVTEVPDPAGSGQSVFDLTVNNQDVAPITPTENPRAQMLSPGIIHPGDEFWLETKFFIPTGMPYVSEWMSLVSIYGPPFEGSSPWQISINEHELRWMRNGGHGYDIPWKAPLSAAEGNWTTVLLHEKFATEGFVEMWINGQQINFFSAGASRNPSHEPQTTHLSMETMDSSNDGGVNAAKIMQYRAVNMFQSASVYFQPLRIGTTRSSVEY